MKKNLISIMAMGLVISSCSNIQESGGASKGNKSSDCLPDSLSALCKGKKLLIDMYGRDSTSRTFKAILSNDSTWAIIAQTIIPQQIKTEDTIHLNRGGESVLINKRNCRVIGFYIAR